MVLSYFFGRRLFKGKVVDPAWAARGRVIYHRPASWWNKHPYLIVGGIAIMTGINAEFVALHSKVLVSPSPNSTASSEAGDEFVLRPLSHRIAGTVGVLVAGTALGAFVMFAHTRIVKRLHLLAPIASNSARTQAGTRGALLSTAESGPVYLMVESVVNRRAEGRIFEIDRVQLIPGQKPTELSLRIAQIRGQWLLNLTNVLTPNIALGPNEELRIKEQIEKIIWDYKSTHARGIAPKEWVPKPLSGLYHDFPWEPSMVGEVQEGPLRKGTLEETLETAAARDLEKDSSGGAESLPSMYESSTRKKSRKEMASPVAEPRIESQSQEVPQLSSATPSSTRQATSRPSTPALSAAARFERSIESRMDSLTRAAEKTRARQRS